MALTRFLISVVAVSMKNRISGNRSNRNFFIQSSSGSNLSDSELMQ